VCQNCGCQSVRAVDELTREHDAVLGLVRLAAAAARNGDRAAAALTASQLLELLAPHTAVEEEGLFPAVAREHPGHIQVLVGEHARIEGVLGDIARGSTGTGWSTQLDEVLQLLREHIAKEQDGVFPAAVISLSGEDWAVVDAVRARVGSPLTTGAAAQ